MVKGALDSLTPGHIFRTEKDVTLVEDSFNFESLFGQLCILFSEIYWTDDMRFFLNNRLRIVKAIAESNDWQMSLSS
jgi:hypothetical protein